MGGSRRFITWILVFKRFFWNWLKYNQIFKFVDNRVFSWSSIGLSSELSSGLPCEFVLWHIHFRNFFKVLNVEFWEDCLGGFNTLRQWTILWFWLDFNCVYAHVKNIVNISFWENEVTRFRKISLKFTKSCIKLISDNFHFGPCFEIWYLRNLFGLSNRVLPI